MAAGSAKPASKAPRKTKEMTAGGASANWAACKVTHMKQGDKFLAHIADTDAELSARWGTNWAQVPEAEARSTEIYGHLATYLVEYEIGSKDRGSGGGLAVKTAHGYWRGLINERSEHFAKSKEAETQVRGSPCARARSSPWHSHCTSLVQSLDIPGTPLTSLAPVGRLSSDVSRRRPRRRASGSRASR